MCFYTFNSFFFLTTKDLVTICFIFFFISFFFCDEMSVVVIKAHVTEIWDLYMYTQWCELLGMQDESPMPLRLITRE